MAENREVVDSGRFVADRDGLTDDVERWDEVMKGVVWALSKSPEKGQPTDAPDIMALPTVVWDGAPPLVIYYRYDDERVDLLSVQRGDVENEE